MDRNKFIAMTAHMEGQAVIVKNMGRKIKVSQMELICLCNFAKLGLLSVFAELDGDTGNKAGVEMDKLVVAIRDTFPSEANPNGLARLAQSTVAMFGGRLGEYVLPTTDEEESL